MKAPIGVQNKVSLFYRKHDNNASHNLIKMGRNAITVIDKNLLRFSIGDKRRLHRKAVYWLYDWFGYSFFNTMSLINKRDNPLWSGDRRVILGRFLKHSCVDFRFGKNNRTRLRQVLTTASFQGQYLRCDANLRHALQ